MHFSFTSRLARHSRSLTLSRAHQQAVYRTAKAVLLLMITLPLTAEIVDRVEIAIGHEAITRSEIDEELRVTALLNHTPPQINPATQRAAAGRLVEQFLVAREIEVSHFPLPDAKEVAAYEQGIERDFGGAAGLAHALAAYNITQPVLDRHLALQLRILRFTEFRFPTDEALNIWLQESRKRFNIVYLDKALQ